MERIDKLQAEVEKTFGVRLADKCRDAVHSDARAVFANVAKRFGYKLREIGQRTGRPHASTINSQRQYNYLPRPTQNVGERIFEACLTDSEAIQRMALRMEQMDYLTENEKIYRTLNAQQKAIYDERVTNLLKML